MRVQKKLNLVMLTALVAGNMVGSGIFLLPSSLAEIGSISLISWCLTATGAFLLAIVFSKMSLIVPKTGGPYAFAHAGFGDFIGFQTAYSYWIAIFVGNSALVVALIGYLRVFFPQLANIQLSLWTGLIVVWVFTIVNIMGVRCVGLVQIVTTVLKFIPLLLIAIIGWWYVHPEFFIKGFNVYHQSDYSAVSHAATLTLWAFIGMESATVPADSVVNPIRNIPLATLLGTLIAAVIYILSSTAVMGMIPMPLLAKSVSPFADAAQIIFGEWGRWLIAAGAVISCLGALNGWIMLQGQIPMAAAEDKLFPSFLAKRAKNGIPVYAVIITSVLVSAMLFLTCSEGLLKQFEMMILIATLASLIPYLYTAVSLIIKLPAIENKSGRVFFFVIAFLATAYAFWAIIGAGKDTLVAGSIFLFSSIPLYAWVYWHKHKIIK